MNKRGRYGRNISTQFRNLHIQDQPSTSRGNYSSSQQSRRVAAPVTSKKNPHLLNMNHFGGKTVTYRNLHPSEHMYQHILDLITNDDIIVENIVKVDNVFLKKAYDLKKSQKQKEFGEVYESLVFHGTKKANVNSICNNNFDWRLYNRHKYGKGVSFSTNAKYASCYADDEYHKVMIVAKVQIANVCQGHEDMVYPPPGFDTSQKGDNGVVLVKYEDNEFYPAYKLYYHLNDGEEEVEEEEQDDYYFDEDGEYYDLDEGEHYFYDDEDFDDSSDYDYYGYNNYYYNY